MTEKLFKQTKIYTLILAIFMTCVGVYLMVMPIIMITKGSIESFLPMANGTSAVILYLYSFFILALAIFTIAVTVFLYRSFVKLGHQQPVGSLWYISALVLSGVLAVSNLVALFFGKGALYIVGSILYVALFLGGVTLAVLSIRNLSALRRVEANGGQYENMYNQDMPQQGSYAQPNNFGQQGFQGNQFDQNQYNHFSNPNMPGQDVYGNFEQQQSPYANQGNMSQQVQQPVNPFQPTEGNLSQQMNNQTMGEIPGQPQFMHNQMPPVDFSQPQQMQQQSQQMPYLDPNGQQPFDPNMMNQGTPNNMQTSNQNTVPTQNPFMPNEQAQNPNGQVQNNYNPFNQPTMPDNIPTGMNQNPMQGNPETNQNPNHPQR